MARKEITETCCDDCTRHGIDDAPASTFQVISVNGGPHRHVDLCARDEKTFMDYVMGLYERGTDLPPSPAEKPRAVEVAKTEAKPPTAKPKKPAAKKERSATPPVQAGKDGGEEGRRYIICTLPHRSQKGGPKKVDHRQRGGHARTAHNGLSLWDIRWEDPEGIFQELCTSHEKCVENKVGYPAQRNLDQHLRSCDLPRIDLSPDEGGDD